LRVELHAQECFLLLRGPAKSAHFRSCARIQTKKELLICWSRRPQAVHHLVAILPDCPRKSAALFSLKLPVHTARSFLLSFYSGELRKPQHAFMRFSSSFKILFTTKA